MPFDPGVLLCRNGDASTCLTAPQVEAVGDLHGAGAREDRAANLRRCRRAASSAGKRWPARLLSIRAHLLPEPGVQGSSWDYKTRPVNFDTDVDKADAPENLVINANNPDLTGFIARGGKLMLIGGWGDTRWDPDSNVDYYESVVKKVGARNARDSVSLFMVPGMDHCLGERYPTAPTVRLRCRRRTTTVEGERQGAGSNRRRRVGQRQARPQRLVCAYPRRSASTKDRANTGDPWNFVCKNPLRKSPSWLFFFFLKFWRIRWKPLCSAIVVAMAVGCRPRPRSRRSF